MEKFIPREKLSKKAQNELNKKARKDWNGLSPVTRKPESKKAYSRKRVHKIDFDYTNSYFIILFLRRRAQHLRHTEPLPDLL